MSRITFLDNASQGKNDWWRYILTIIINLVGPIVLAVLITIILDSLLYTGSDVASSTSNFFLSPLFGILLSLVLTVISFMIFYLCMRFIHGKKLISLINTTSNVSWKKILKGFGLSLVLMAFGALIYSIIDPGSFEVTFNPNNFVFILALVLIIAPITAFTSKLFLGYLLQGAGLISKKPIVPLLITSLILIIPALSTYGSDSVSILNGVIMAFIWVMAMGTIVLGENRLETVVGIETGTIIFLSVVANPYGLQTVPSILTIHSTLNPFLNILIYALYALALLVVIFWNKKSRMYRIFKPEENF